MAESIGFSALAFALAALGTEGSGSGGETGTVSVRINQVFTIEPDEPARVENIGTEQEVILNLYIPRGYQGEQGVPGQNGSPGANGNRWYNSEETPGTPVYNMVNGDYVLYTTGQVYQMITGELKNTGINLAGSSWLVQNIPPNGVVPIGAKNGDYIVYNDSSVWRVVNGRLANTGINLKGQDGFTPTIEVKEDTEDSYVLTITNAEGEFDTPNLKGSGSSSTSFDMYGYAQSIGYEGTEDEFKEAFLRALNFFTKKDTVVDGNADPSKDPTLDGGDSDEEIGIDIGEAELTFSDKFEESTTG